MTTQQQRDALVSGPPVTVRVGAIRSLAESWVAQSHRGSSRWECGVSLLGVLAAATDDGRDAVAVRGDQR